MSRLSKRLARKRTGRAASPPAAQLRAEAAKLCEIAPDDPQVIATVDAFAAVDEMISDGYTLRVGGPDEPKRAEPLPEWKREPPEWGEK